MNVHKWRVDVYYCIKCGTKQEIGSATSLMAKIMLDGGTNLGILKL
jgi:hypothetical protein